MDFVYELHSNTYAVQCNGRISRCCQIELGSSYLLYSRVISYVCHEFSHDLILHIHDKQKSSPILED